MVRTLYRIYLYTVWVLLLIFATVASAAVFGTLLSGTPLNGQTAAPPARQTLIQQLALLVIAWAIVLTLGGLHYWLIRRDIRDDPGAGRGPVRALYLNVAEGAAILVAMPTTAFALASLGDYYSGGEASGIGAGVAAYALFAVLEMERRRSPARPGGALTLQRLHFYGVHLILLVISTALWLNALSQTLVAALVGTGQLANTCTATPGVYECYVSGYGATASQPGWLWVGALAAALPVALYAFLGRADVRSSLRQTLHFVCYSYGIVFVLVGVDRLAQLLILATRGRAITLVDIVGGYDFVSPAVFGLIVVALYGLWLGRDAVRGPMGAHTLGLTTLAITAGILAAPFWVGCGELLYDLLERNVYGGASITRETFAQSIALLLIGLAYIPLAVRLRQQSRVLGRPTPRRGLVLALLAAGTLTAAGGLAVTLFTVVTASIGAPLDHWQETARSSGVTLVIGLTLTAIYAQRAIAEGFFRRQPAASGDVRDDPAITQPAGIPHAETGPAPSLSLNTDAAIPARDMPVESVLDELLAGRVTRDEAAAQIRELLTVERQ